MPEETFLHLFLWARNQRAGAEQDQLSCGCTEPSSGNCRKTKLTWFGHVTRHDIISKISHIWAFWRVGDVAVGRGKSGQTASKRRPSPCQNYPQWLPAEKEKKRLEEDLCWNVLVSPPLPKRPTGPRTDLNWIEQSQVFIINLIIVVKPFKVDISVQDRYFCGGSELPRQG